MLFSFALSFVCGTMDMVLLPTLLSFSFPNRGIVARRIQTLKEERGLPLDRRVNASTFSTKCSLGFDVRRLETSCVFLSRGTGQVARWEVVVKPRSGKRTASVRGVAVLGEKVVGYQTTTIRKWSTIRLRSPCRNPTPLQPNPDPRFSLSRHSPFPGAEHRGDAW